LLLLLFFLLLLLLLAAEIVDTVDVDVDNGLIRRVRAYSRLWVMVYLDVDASSDQLGVIAMKSIMLMHCMTKKQFWNEETLLHRVRRTPNILYAAFLSLARYPVLKLSWCGRMREKREPTRSEKG